MLGLNKRVIAGIGVALALAVAGVSGVALAETPAPTPTSAAATTTTQKTDYGQVFLGKLATILGVDQAKLQASVKQAQSDTIDQAVANGDLAKNQADAMKLRIEQNGAEPFGIRGLDGMGRGGFGHGGPGMGVVDNSAVEKAVADKLGMSVADLETQLHSGSTLASLAQAKSLNVQDLYTAAANAAKPQLDQAVKDGKLTQAQADQIYQQIQQGQHMLRGPMGGAPAGSGPMGRPFGGRGMR